MERLLKIFRPIAKIVLPRTIASGVDIQDRHIALVALKRDFRGGNIEAVWSSQIVAEDVIEDGRLARPATLFESLKTFVQLLVFSRLNAEPVFVISIPPQHVYTETAVFPLMARGALEEAVNLKIETSLPWLKSEAYIDWRILRVDDPRKIAVFIAAAPKMILDEYLRVFLRGKLRVAACEFHLMSLMRSVIPFSPQPSIVLLLDEDGAELAVARDGEICAHSLKQGLRDGLKETIPFEIRRLAAWAESELGYKVSKVYSYDKIGETQKLENLAEATGLPVEPIHLGASLFADPRFVIAAGAARRHLSSANDGINLAPAGSGGRTNENLILRTLNLWANILAIFSAIMVAAFAAVFFYVGRSAEIVARENRRLNPILERQIAFSQDIIRDAARFNELIRALGAARKYETRVADKLSFLVSEAARAGVNVASVRASEPGGPLQAVLRAPTRESILSLKTAIEAGEEFSSFEVPAAELLKSVDLTINATLRY